MQWWGREANGQHGGAPQLFQHTAWARLSRPSAGHPSSTTPHHTPPRQVHHAAPASLQPIHPPTYEALDALLDDLRLRQEARRQLARHLPNQLVVPQLLAALHSSSGEARGLLSSSIYSSSDRKKI